MVLLVLATLGFHSTMKIVCHIDSFHVDTGMKNTHTAETLRSHGI